jgi:chaperonin GroES
MRLRPLHDWVLVERTEAEERTAGGIIIPSSAKEKPSEGIVQAVGPGRYKKEKEKKEKKFIPTVLKPGERIVFVDYKARDIDFDGRQITLIREEDVLGIYEGDVHKAERTAAMEGFPAFPGAKKTPEIRTSPEPKEVKKVTARKTAPKAKPAAKKAKAAATKKTVARKAKPRKVTAAPRTAKRPAAGKTTAKKTATKKVAVKKTRPAKAAAAGKTAKKRAVEKATAGKTATKKTSVKKNVSKKPATKKTVKKTLLKAKKRAKK